MRRVRRARKARTARRIRRVRRAQRVRRLPASPLPLFIPPSSSLYLRVYGCVSSLSHVWRCGVCVCSLCVCACACALRNEKGDGNGKKVHREKAAKQKRSKTAKNMALRKRQKKRPRHFQEPLAKEHVSAAWALARHDAPSTPFVLTDIHDVSYFRLRPLADEMISLTTQGASPAFERDVCLFSLRAGFDSRTWAQLKLPQLWLDAIPAGPHSSQSEVSSRPGGCLGNVA